MAKGVEGMGFGVQRGSHIACLRLGCSFHFSFSHFQECKNQPPWVK